MTVLESLGERWKTAAVAAAIVVALDAYSGELTASAELLVEFVLHAVAFWVGFTLGDLAWNAAFGADET